MATANAADPILRIEARSVRLNPDRRGGGGWGGGVGGWGVCGWGGGRQVEGGAYGRVGWGIVGGSGPGLKLSLPRAAETMKHGARAMMGSGRSGRRGRGEWRKRACTGALGTIGEGPGPLGP